MRSGSAKVLVFCTSAAVLVVEILAGRLLAPYIGVSLETFTVIIGTILAGIAAGNALGGFLADRADPRKLIGPMLVAGGALTWLSLPIASALGPVFNRSAVAMVILVAATFILPAIALSTVSPMVAKLVLSDLDDTGVVVGGISAAGTVGAIAGTFVTGFFLVSAAPTRPIMLTVGALLVVGGIGFGFDRWRRPAPAAAMLALVGMSGALGSSARVPCEIETAYFCARVEPDENRPSGRSLYLDQLRHSYIDLEDPSYLDFRYMRIFEDVIATLPPGPLRVLHIGGGGFTMPRYLSHVRPGTTGHVLEIDGELVDLAVAELGLELGPDLSVAIGDGRLALADLEPGSFDLIIGDAFGSISVPWHLTTVEVIERIETLLAPDGVYIMNLIDGGTNGFSRAELATLDSVFDHVGAVLPSGGVPVASRANQILIGSNSTLGPVVVDPDDGTLADEDTIAAMISDALVLRDDFAPVDQLLLSS